MFAVIFICIRIILVSWDDWEIKKQRLCKISGAKKVYCGRCAKGECDVFAVFASLSLPSRLAPSPRDVAFYHVINIFPPFWRSPPQMFALSMREGGCVLAVSTLHNDVSIQAYFLLLFICQWVFSIWKEWLRVNTFAHGREFGKRAKWLVQFNVAWTMNSRHRDKTYFRQRPL